MIRVAYRKHDDSVAGRHHASLVRVLRELKSSVTLDEPTFERAYRAYGTRLRSVAFQVLRDHDAAEDAVHGALTRVWSSRAYHADRGALLPFLTACVRREAMDTVRGLKRRHQRELRAASYAPPAIDEIAAVDPIESRRVRRALDALPHRYREIVERCYYHNHTLADIARETNLPLGTVKSRLSAALRLLQAIFTDDGRERELTATRRGR